MSDTLDNASDFYLKTFRDLDASSTTLAGKIFEECEFLHCDFAECVFDHSRFIDCRFHACDLGNLRIVASRFSDTVFEECKLIGIDWTSAHWPHYAAPRQLVFRQSLLDDSSFFGLKLPGIVMTECKARHADFRDGNFHESDFTHTEFEGSLFGKSDLTKADFSEASGYDIDLRDNLVKGAKFTRFEAVRLLREFGIELVD